MLEFKRKKIEEEKAKEKDWDVRRCNEASKTTCSRTKQELKATGWSSIWRAARVRKQRQLTDVHAWSRRFLSQLANQHRETPGHWHKMTTGQALTAVKRMKVAMKSMTVIPFTLGKGTTQVMSFLHSSIQMKKMPMIGQILHTLRRRAITRRSEIDFLLMFFNEPLSVVEGL